MEAYDRKGKKISVGNIVESKHGKKYRVLDFLADTGDNVKEILVKVEPMEDNSVWRMDRELEVIQ